VDVSVGRTSGLNTNIERVLIGEVLPPVKPKQRGGGRPPGSLNKITRDVRLMITKALVLAGGVAYLRRQADANPAAFLGLVGKTLPKEVNLNANGSLRLTMYLSTEEPPQE
jgi:hypothetical protein